jgi:hypothetical protein
MGRPRKEHKNKKVTFSISPTLHAQMESRWKAMKYKDRSAYIQAVIEDDLLERRDHVKTEFGRPLKAANGPTANPNPGPHSGTKSGTSLTIPQQKPMK